MPRYHLSYEYQNYLRGWVNNCDKVVIADSLEEAVSVIAREVKDSLPKLSSIRIKKRFFTGRPAGEAEIINRDFQV